MSLEDKILNLNDLYESLPNSIKKITGLFYRNIPKRIKYGKFYYKYLERIFNFNNYNKERFITEQIRKNMQSSPFYQNISLPENLEDIIKIPIITKDDILKNYTHFCNKNMFSKKLVMNTGGGSGTPLEFYLEKGKSRPKETAHFDWFWGSFGYNKHPKTLMLRGKPLSKNRLYEHRSIDNKFNISCYLINGENIFEIVMAINKFKPQFIHAYPSALLIFTKLLDRFNLKIDSKFTTIFLGSEYLSSQDREYFEMFYGCRVINWYGHSERLIFGGNCQYSNEYHFHDFYGYMELVDNNNKTITTTGEIGRIIATGFDNDVMPFVRYDTGDLGILSENKSCKCGFQGQSLSKIYGREKDFIFLKDGSKISITAFIYGQHLEAFKKILEFQIVQNIIGLIVIRIVAFDNYYEEDEIKMKNKLIDSVKNNIDIKFEYVKKLEKTHRGKHRFLISNLTE